MLRATPHLSARLIGIVGGLLALIFGVGLVYVVVSDRTRRLDAALAQSAAFANGGQRLLNAQFLNLQRAMEGIAEDSRQLMASVPGSAPSLIAQNMEGVSRRQGELLDLLLVNAAGEAITPGAGDPTLPTWTREDVAATALLRLGPLQNVHGEWILPIAVPTGDGRWVLARLRQRQLQDVVDHLRWGRDGVATITDRFGTILARTGDGSNVIGRSTSALFVPAAPDAERRVSRIDGKERLIAVSAPETFALWVGVGVPVAEVLGPWYRFVAFCLLIYIVYWAGFIYLYRHLALAAHDQREYVAHLTEATVRLAEAEQRFRLTFDKNPLPFWVYDVSTLAFLEVNEAAVRNYGYTREEFRSMRITDIRSAHDADSLKDVIASLRLGHDGDPDRVWIHRRKDGSTLDVVVHAADIDMPGYTARLVLAQDVTERIRSERALTYRATHDTTTGLPNTDALVDYLDRGLGPDAWYEVVYVHLRGVDRVSDTFGLDAGRSVLRSMATRLGGVAAAHGMVAHRPGERFLLAVTDPARRDDAIAAIRAAVSEPVALNDTLHTLEPQIGLATHPDDGRDARQVIANAALAAHVRTDDADDVHRFVPAMAERSVARLILASRMREAIDAGRLAMHFQPVVDAHGGQVRKVEALVRWPQADGSWIPPNVFIPLCEETGLIVPLGEWVVETAACAHTSLADAGLGHLSIAVNVSALQFRRTDVAALVRDTVRRHDLPSHALELELTESSLMDPVHAVGVLSQLRQQGTRVSLDDFGTGFSSMAYLRDLPIDTLKIDRSFVADIDTDERAASICHSMIQLAHTLGMSVVAEGVERAAQERWLRDSGCDYLQGFHVGAPVTLAELVPNLRAAAVP
ncbi:PAS domain S-box-containing protein [Luteibacter sp. UNCMF331Sha3.1]|uniref:bifunctional diguanylate cyclase/phosphodiesterase n=1 Tax=Luteibacter sp. UNCMF331Sha3.1 TaxID=1502760 RepID=UPI0008D2B433|nr:EAL domain-containing protein [Luteibacter sp. UNCMF331Sha3.1]SEN21074.1 PAS domain S-box-containing protein [Luteibacter sp. UNCMF331Sha3.1]